MALAQYPLEIRECKPHIHATRINGVRMDGLPDGCHTGGAYLCPDGTVWKPLDGRPYLNADSHWATREAECLAELADTPLFPKNWDLRQANGRSWVVRLVADILDETGARQLSLSELRYIQRGIYQMNAAGWMFNDALSMGRDRQTGELFIVDLSCAHKLDRPESECWRLDKYLKEAGHWTSAYKTQAVKMLRDRREDAMIRGIAAGRCAVYCSPDIEPVMEGVEVEVTVKQDIFGWWVLTSGNLPEDMVDDLNLVIGYEIPPVYQVGKEAEHA